MGAETDSLSGHRAAVGAYTADGLRGLRLGLGSRLLIVAGGVFEGAVLRLVHALLLTLHAFAVAVALLVLVLLSYLIFN